MEENEITTIQIRKKTRKRLGEIGGKDETFDDIVGRLIDLYEEHRIDQMLEEKLKRKRV